MAPAGSFVKVRERSSQTLAIVKMPGPLLARRLDCSDCVRIHPLSSDIALDYTNNHLHYFKVRLLRSRTLKKEAAVVAVLKATHRSAINYS